MVFIGYVYVIGWTNLNIAIISQLMLKYNKQVYSKKKEATVNYIGMLLSFQKQKDSWIYIPSL